MHMMNRAHGYLFHPDVIKNQINQSHRMHIKYLLGFRLFVLAYMTVVMCQTIISETDFMHNFLYLTLWGAFITYTYFTLAVLENISYLSNGGNQFFEDSHWQLTHMLFTVAFCLELPIFLLFWGYIYPRIDLPSTSSLILQINLHGGFFLCILIDEFINDIEFVRRHLYVLVTVTLLYGLTNMIFVFSSGGIVIYPDMTWTNIISYVTNVMCLILILSAFYLGQFLHKRVKLHRIKNDDNFLLARRSSERAQY